MNIEVLLDETQGIEHVDKIFHIADVHIRTLKRHTEYREVFQNLYDQIDEYSTENSLIVLVGDIVHAKTDMTPELVVLVSEFLRELSSRCETILIPGNHDCNLKNTDRLDTLTPIVDNMTLPGLHYIKESGLFRIGQCVFSHFSQWDNPEDWIPASEIPDEFTKVALYHGIVDKSTTDTGFILESECVTADVFKGFDAGMLGDIHKRQFVDVARKVAYSGSLIQQNHGENFGDHGYVLWDMGDVRPEFKDVHNDYGYFTLRVNRATVPLCSYVPNKPRLRLEISNTSASEKKRVIADMRKFYDLEELTFSRTVDGVDRDDVINKLEIADIKSPEYQSELISEYVMRNHDVDDEMLARVENINYDLNQNITPDTSRRNIQWSLKTFEFSNMFSYGEGNKIDFQKMGGIMGLFADNASGKSSILDAISFCLFDKCSRTYKSTKILNNKSDWFSCRAVIDINGTEYVIEREAEKTYGRVPVDVKFYKNTENGMVNLTGEQRRDTNATIRQYIGEYEDFIMTALSTQKDNTIFIEKSQAERKDLLSKFIGIEVFDGLYSDAKDEIRDVEGALKHYEKEDLSSKLADVETKHDESLQKYNALKKERKQFRSQKDKIEEKIIKQNRRIKDVSSVKNIDIDKLKSRKSSLENRFESAKEKLKTVGIKKRENQQPLRGFESMLESIDQDEIESQYQDMTRWKQAVRKKRSKLESLESKIQSVQETIDHLTGHEFDPECEYCVNRNKRDATKLARSRERLDNLKDRRSEVKTWLDENDSKYDVERIEQSYEKVQTWKDKISKFKSKVTKWDNKSNKLIVEKEQIKSELSNVNSKIEEYEKTKKQIQEKQDAERRISELKSALSTVKSKLDNMSSNIQKHHSNIKIAEREKERIQEEMNEYGQLSGKYEAYEYYIEAVKRDGVPYELIDKTMPRIEEEVNKILSQVVDFGLMVELDGKNINAYIVYDENRYWALEIASNFERFISSLAIRVALANIANLPCANFLAIDEGFSVADSTNLNSMNLLFDYMKTQFEFVIIISHLEMMRDMVSGLIEISKKEDGLSKVSYI